MARLMEMRREERETLDETARMVVAILRHFGGKTRDEIRDEARRAFREAILPRPPVEVRTVTGSDGEPLEATNLVGVFCIGLDGAGIDRADPEAVERATAIVDAAITFELVTAISQQGRG
jgi:hypothetical protein